VAKQTQRATSKESVEYKIAERAASAFGKARQRALDAKQDLLVAEDGRLVRISPDGSRLVVGEVKWPAKQLAFQYKRDAEIAIRWAKPQD
jgi:hypothetical protein